MAGRMKKKKEHRKRKNIIFVRPTLKFRYHILLYLFTTLFSVLSIIFSQKQCSNFIIAIVVYVLAGTGLTISCLYLKQDLSKDIRHKTISLLENYSLSKRLYHDYQFRTEVMTSCSFLINVFYAVSNAVYGICKHSPWLGTLSAYYIFLSIMRFWIVRYTAKKEKYIRHNNTWDYLQKEVRIYRNTGAALSIMTIALAGAVVLLLHQKGGYSYAGYLIFVVAAYTFYKVIISVVHMIRAKKMKSILLITIRNIGYADSLVSVLALQTAMFASFGGETTEAFKRQMNGITGALICVMILSIGIYMVVNSQKAVKKIL